MAAQLSLKIETIALTVRLTDDADDESFELEMMV